MALSGSVLQEWMLLLTSLAVEEGGENANLEKWAHVNARQKISLQIAPLSTSKAKRWLYASFAMKPWLVTKLSGEQTAHRDHEVILRGNTFEITDTPDQYLCETRTQIKDILRNSDL